MLPVQLIGKWKATRFSSEAFAADSWGTKEEHATLATMLYHCKIANSRYMTWLLEDKCSTTDVRNAFYFVPVELGVAFLNPSRFTYITWSLSLRRAGG